MPASNSFSLGGTLNFCCSSFICAAQSSFVCTYFANYSFNFAISPAVCCNCSELLSYSMSVSKQSAFGDRLHPPNLSESIAILIFILGQFGNIFNSFLRVSVWAVVTLNFFLSFLFRQTFLTATSFSPYFNIRLLTGYILQLRQGQFPNSHFLLFLCIFFFFFFFFL